MTKIQYTALRHGTADNKVYEVELIELLSRNDDRFLVNFRHGRANTAIQEGSKTPSPVTKEQAERLFNSVVVAQVNKGYEIRDGFNPLSEASAQKTSTSHQKNTELSAEERRNRAYRQFSELSRKRSSANYARCNRLIWRLGELRTTRAIPELITAISRGTEKENEIRNYSIAWSLGRCATSQSFNALENLVSSTQSLKVHRMAFHALYAVTPEPERNQWLKQIRVDLPPALSSIIFTKKPVNDNTEHLLNWLNAQRKKERVPFYEQAVSRLTQIYLLSKSDETLRQMILKLCQLATFEFGSFWLIRQLFKIAEYEQDSEIFAVLAHRFENSRAQPFNWQNRSYENTFSNDTRTYLRKRSWRMLRRMGEAADLNYVDMATDLLLTYRDDDPQAQPRSEDHYQWINRSWETTTIEFSGFNSHIALNQILYRNSQQYRPYGNNGNSWHKTSDTGDTARSEAFPHFWDQQPQAFIKLLKASEYSEVHRFALRGLEAQHDFHQQVSANDWGQIFCATYPNTASFAQQQLEKYHQDALRDITFLQSLLEARTETARQFAHQHLQKTPKQQLLKNSDWHIALITSAYADNRELSAQFDDIYRHKKDAQQNLVAQILSYAMARNEDNLPEPAIWDECSRTLFTPLAGQTKQLSFDVISDLVKRPPIPVQKLGAEILSFQQHNPEDIPEDLFLAIIQSPHPEIRAIGVRLLSGMSDDELAKMPQLLAELLLSPDEPIRLEAREIIQRVAHNNTSFSEEMLQELLPHCFRSEKAEGIHDILVACITEDLQRAWPTIDKNQLWRLLLAQSKAAQRIGAAILPTRNHQEYSVRQWAQLGKNPSQSVREWSQTAYTENVSLVRSQFPPALRLLDTDWDDSREFAITYFRQHFSADEWTPDTLILLCDSVRDDIQRLGRDLLREFFKEGDGEHYLLRLSQHPARNVQLFASEFLQTYAGGDAAIMAKLQPYFVTVLSAVNQGRIAKERVLDFLLSEAQKDNTIAQQVADIFEHQSVTVAIRDKSRFIQGMLQLQQQYPDLSLPLKHDKLPVRGFQPEVI